MTDAQFSFSIAEFDRLFDKLKNWGRWGDDDELGTLNFVDGAQTARAARLVRTGQSVSLGRPLDTVAGPDNGRPALHHMTHIGEPGPDSSSYYTDFIGVDFHGKSASHIDALAHVAYKGLLYNGKVAADAVSSRGSSFAPISVLARGVAARGVLLDAARARGLDWVEPPLALAGEDLEAIADTLAVEVRRGDAVLVRSGQVRRRRALGPWDPDISEVGLSITAMEWLAEREVAILGGDGDSDARPSPVEGIGGPVHVLAITALGMCLLDNLDLEALSEACAAAGTYEFLIAVAPLIVPGGTGSPVNPIALL
ncbi:MAG TPA: cyclase family protein [Acidimicrobiales bacterium]|nr:cyclase family protein [Acidimicrobiales bacterium]